MIRLSALQQTQRRCSVLRLPLYQTLIIARPTSSAASARQSDPGSSAAVNGTVQNHHDLQSFLSYASRVDLSPTSTVYVGTVYEYTVLSSLRRLGFDLSRVGGRSDAGIDLLGEWKIPGVSRDPMKVIVQCKAIKAPGPYLIRELEGAFAGAPAGWRRDGVLGVLAVPKGATKGVRDALGKSRLPLCFFKVSLDGTVEQCLWNSASEKEGLAGVGATIRYLSDGGGEKSQVGREVVLTWKGEMVKPADPNIEASS